MLSLKPRNSLLTLAAVTVNWTTSWVTSPFLSLWAVVVRVLSSAKGRVQSQLHSTFSEAEGDTVCKHARQKVPGVGEAGDRKTRREGEWRRVRGGISYQVLVVFCGCFWTKWSKAEGRRELDSLRSQSRWWAPWSRWGSAAGVGPPDLVRKKRGLWLLWLHKQTGILIETETTQGDPKISTRICPLSLHSLKLLLPFLQCARMVKSGLCRTLYF